MNFKERGITVGDLLLFIILLISVLFFLKVKESKKNQSTYLDPVFINKFIEAESVKKII